MCVSICVCVCGHIALVHNVTSYWLTRESINCFQINSWPCLAVSSLGFFEPCLFRMLLGIVHKSFYYQINLGDTKLTKICFTMRPLWLWYSWCHCECAGRKDEWHAGCSYVLHLLRNPELVLPLHNWCNLFIIPVTEIMDIYVIIELLS